MKEQVKITREIWTYGSPDEVMKIIDSLKEQGYETVEAVCKAHNKKVVVLN